jgi:DASH complex subunit ASK1
VSLSGYEEPPEEEAATEDLTEATPSSSYGSPSLPHDDSVTTPTNQRDHSPHDDQSIFASTPSHITPRGPTIAQQPLSIATYASPYEALRREVQGIRGEEPSTSTMPSTPRAHHQSPTPQSSPFHPPSTSRHASHRTPANDVLLHRILDKNWRLQATPHSHAQRLPQRGVVKAAETPVPSTRKYGKRGHNRDPESLDSSPAVPAPQLHAEIFNSPIGRPRVPGVSVLTPARRHETKSHNVFGRDDDPTGASARGAWDSDSDEESGMEGMSPPKTMQFHIPQSKLLRTPGINFQIPPPFFSFFFHRLIKSFYQTQPAKQANAS